jgi:hypothetical protein
MDIGDRFSPDLIFKESAIAPISKEIVPATGWVFNGKGEVTLISCVSEGTGLVSPPTCAKQ